MEQDFNNGNWGLVNNLVTLNVRQGFTNSEGRLVKRSGSLILRSMFSPLMLSEGM